jgi:hypothetical protein
MDDYLRDEQGKYYHKSCLERQQQQVCAYCGKPITERNYISYQDKSYHSDCYKQFVAPRCDICGEPLGDAAITDYWGTRFHPKHAKEFPVCVVCGRLVSKDGREIEPGRWLCPICQETAVNTPEKARELLEKVREQLAGSGIVVRTLGLRIELVSSVDLRDEHKPAGIAHTYAGVMWNSGHAEMGDETATIKILRGLPEDMTRGVIAHELMHLWQHENGADAASMELKEGSANWASSLIYGQLRSQRGQFFIGSLEKSTDPIYGDGYRKVARYADSNGVDRTLEMLKREAAAKIKPEGR